jgi:hypothetical protein
VARPRPLTVDDVVYDAETHTSRLTDGREVPHVTAVLAAVGVATDFEELMRDRPYMRRRVELAGARGTAVHADCHAYDDDDLAWETVSPEVLPFVEAWAQARANLHLRPLARERRVFHPTLCYTGIKDGLFEVTGGEWAGAVVLGDIKTGDPESSACQYQTAAYAEAELVAKVVDRIDRRWAIWLQPERRVPYTVVDYTSHVEAPTDFLRFAAFLTTYRSQAGRRAQRRVAA